ncbi:MAG: filamentous hemagglutinin N-terminal domain-containing protein, partial [Planctomycetota bacterium]
MKVIRKISKKYYIRHIVACFLVAYMLLGVPVRIAMANPDPGAAAFPTGGNVVTGPGTATINPIVDNTLNITDVANGAVIEWNTFDIGSDAAVNFGQVNTSAWVLNNVLATDSLASGIAGQLNANGNIIVSNPLGIVVAPTGMISARTAILSSLRVDKDLFGDFADGTIGDLSLYSEVGDMGSIINKGLIKVEDSVALLAKKVLNLGTITTGTGGCVIMAAGDSIILGQPGSKVIVEMESVSEKTDPDEYGLVEGDVVNDVIDPTDPDKEYPGEIKSPEGTIVLAAGDMFSAALDPVVQSGAGRVIQNSKILANGGTDIEDTGNGGSVTITAAEEITFGADSLTTANAAPAADPTSDEQPFGGQILISSPETVTFDLAAQLEAKGNGIYDVEDNHRFDFGVDEDFRGSIQVAGKYITPEMDVDLTSYDSDFAGLLTIGPFKGDLTIADGPLPSSPAENIIYEEWIEGMSDVGINVDLLSPGNIIAQTFSSGGDEGLQGGSGDMSFRNKFESGGITFDTADDITTDLGGNVFMVAGSGGITAGHIHTYVSSSDKVTEPGQIVLLTTGGGDIETGSMITEGGSDVEISAIASGNLTVNGDVISKTHQVSYITKNVGKALICLIAAEDVIVNGSEISVDALGREDATAELLISAGENVDIANPETSEGSAEISAEATTSQKCHARADIVIHAGWNLENPGIDSGEISINGIPYDGDSGSDNSSLPISARAAVYGSWASTDTSDDYSEDDPRNDNDDGSSKFWYDENKEGTATASIEIDNSEEDPPSDPISPCFDCPVPPFLPPIPILTKPDIGSGHMNDPITGNVLDNDPTPPGDLIVVDFTQPSNGSVTVDENGDYIYIP